ncbi:MAG: class I mannose-6-phosphate isomerase [Polyangiaceae bacterium]|nr:class I mannose-6-phosphate isomerase [Polyangiaceae bacterium]
MPTKKPTCPHGTEPILLAVDNFTPPSRTPWGGTKIAGRYKRALLALDARAEPSIVGESWELSVEPDFPSRASDGRPLPELFSEDLRAYLGPDEAALGGARLLVKLLDAAEPLSVQIHPSDDSPGLSKDESGKPEAWYVVEREAGAGLYVGLRDGVTESRLRQAIEAGEDVSSLFCFVPVEPGDFFVIEAGTPHAIGAGITLVEPQRVLPGRRGITYRYWDWNRRYAVDGSASPTGEPRPLHLREALAVTAWQAPRERALLERIRLRAGEALVDSAARSEVLAGPDGPIASTDLKIARLSGTGIVELEHEPRLRGLTVVEGSITLRGDHFAVEVPAGRTAALPAALGGVVAELDRAHGVLSSIP